MRFDVYPLCIYPNTTLMYGSTVPLPWNVLRPVILLFCCSLHKCSQVAQVAPHISQADWKNVPEKASLCISSYQVPDLVYGAETCPTRNQTKQQKWCVFCLQHYPLAVHVGIFRSVEWLCCQTNLMPDPVISRDSNNRDMLSALLFTYFMFLDTDSAAARFLPASDAEGKQQCREGWFLIHDSNMNKY